MHICAAPASISRRRTATMHTRRWRGSVCRRAHAGLHAVIAALAILLPSAIGAVVLICAIAAALSHTDAQSAHSSTFGRISAGVCSTVDRLCVETGKVVAGTPLLVWFPRNVVPATDLDSISLSLIQGSTFTVSEPCTLSGRAIMNFSAPLKQGPVDSVGNAASFNITIDADSDSLMPAIESSNQFFFLANDPSHRYCLFGPFQNSGKFTHVTVDMPKPQEGIVKGPSSADSDQDQTPGSTPSPGSPSSPSATSESGSHSNSESGSARESGSSVMSPGVITGIAAVCLVLIIASALLVMGRNRRPFRARRHPSSALALSANPAAGASAAARSVSVRRLDYGDENIKLAPFDQPRFSSSSFGSTTSESHMDPQDLPLTIIGIPQRDPESPAECTQPTLYPPSYATNTSKDRLSLPLKDRSTEISRNSSADTIIAVSKVIGQTATQPGPLTPTAMESIQRSVVTGRSSGFSSEDAILVAQAFRQELMDPSIDWDKRSDTDDSASAGNPSRNTSRSSKFSTASSQSNGQFSSMLCNPFGAGSRRIVKE